MSEQSASSGIVVIGASAGGVEALRKIVGMLPVDLPAAVFVNLHVSAHGTSVLPQILTRCGTLPARHPVDGERIVCGRIYVAPPDVHLVVEQGVIRLSKGPKENGHRPSIDVLFRTAAHVYGRQVVGVVLSGNLDDGTRGLATIKQHGGIGIVQDPTTADYPSMPTNAINGVEVDRILPLEEIAAAIVEAVSKMQGQNICVGADPDPELVDPPARSEGDPDADSLDDGARNELALARPSVYSCPDCGGVLMEIDDGRTLSFRCRVGHAWSPESLLAEEGGRIEDALWMALRALEERGQLARRVATRADGHGNAKIAEQFRRRAASSDERADILRELLTLWGRNSDSDAP